MQDLLSKKVARSYFRSSSFKMAMLHALLIGLSALILGYIIYIIAPQNLNVETLDSLKSFSAIILVLMLCVVLVSLGISHFVVSRINKIAITAQSIIDTGDLSKRISIDTKWDDLSNLAQVLNGFLVRIEDLMASVREVNNNIAHDLRTPLTRLRTDIELLKGKDVTNDELQELLTEIDRILSVFHSLLRISNIQKGKRYQEFEEINLSILLEDVMKKLIFQYFLKMVEEINLSILLEDVIELFEPMATEKHVKLINVTNDNLKITGDADLLFQLFANLLDNAIKFSSSKSEVQIITNSEPGKISTIIKDSGPGIRDDEKEYVFQQFYRGDESRKSQGFGLGLSLVKAVIDRHHGEIKLKDGSPGLEVWITFKTN